jgi:hypothetical protein
MHYAGSRGIFIYMYSEMLGTYRETYRLVSGTGYMDIADTPACIIEKLFTFITKFLKQTKLTVAKHKNFRNVPYRRKNIFARLITIA